VGFKVHFSAVCSVGVPHLITNVDTTAAVRAGASRMRSLNDRPCESWPSVLEKPAWCRLSPSSDCARDFESTKSYALHEGGIMTDVTGKSSKSGMGFYSSDIENSDSDRGPSRALKTACAALAECTIIAAVNKVEFFEKALESPARAIYLLTGNPLNLPDMLERARQHSKVCLINIDFLAGLARDRYAVEFLAAHHVDGIVSTRIEVLKAAHDLDLITVQRTFAIDSAAIMATLKSLNQFVPDAMEVLPAMVAPKVARRLHASFPHLAIIGGGLIEGVREIEELLGAGIRSVSVSDSRLWLV
jgi:glycerol uptake operon antiterminator